nr:unnamed protein product [Callosobruchus analis]
MLENSGPTVPRYVKSGTRGRAGHVG